MSNISEKLKEYFENTPHYKVIEDWEKTADFDNIGITVEEFIKTQKDIDPEIQEAANKIIWDCL